MVITTVPAGTSQSAGASNSTPGVGRRCAGEQCEKPVARKGKGGKGGLDRFCADCRASITGSTASPELLKISPRATANWNRKSFGSR